MQRSKSGQSMSALGHFRQIEPLATPAECLLCSDRIQSFARRLNVVECQTRTAYATWHPQHGQPSLVLIPIRRA